MGKHAAGAAFKKRSCLNCLFNDAKAASLLDKAAQVLGVSFALQCLDQEDGEGGGGAISSRCAAAFLIPNKATGRKCMRRSSSAFLAHLHPEHTPRQASKTPWTLRGQHHVTDVPKTINLTEIEEGHCTRLSRSAGSCPMASPRDNISSDTKDLNTVACTCFAMAHHELAQHARGWRRGNVAAISSLSGCKMDPAQPIRIAD
jgi:hypothetical protein